ncbi:MAG TPA: hypothetical protein VD813_10900 [Pseudonocardia sp.]|nr:hypothetical protein [Pseudonocardia sp.]
MAWLFAQVWALCVMAFLLGSLATWVAFVLPLRRARRETEVAGPSPPPPPPDPVPAAAELTPRPVAAADPALSALDTRPATGLPAPGIGAAATGALDLLGIGGPPPARSPEPGASPARSPESGEPPEPPRPPGAPG